MPLPTARNAQGRTQTGQTHAANDAEGAEGGVRIRYYHCDQIGTPRELTRPTGEITWQATYKAWGNTQTVQWEVAQGAASAAQGQTIIDVEHDRVDRSGQQPLRFQGQYFDDETGLHYNRFRYYDPDCGRFISHDPIGLLGGENTFGYVPNPGGWVDPLGLQKGPGTGCPGCDELECRTIEARLNSHVSAAQANLSSRASNGLSSKQVDHVKNGNGWAYAMHYGTQLDSEVKKLVRQDSWLMSKIHIPTGGPKRPDFINNNRSNKKCRWFDLTTQNGWLDHVKKYGSKGRHISYQAPARNF